MFNSGNCHSDHWPGKWKRRPLAEANYACYRNGTSRKFFKPR